MNSCSAERSLSFAPQTASCWGTAGRNSIEAPGHYSAEAIGLLKEIGIDDKETFGVDKLVPGAGVHSTPEAVTQIPIEEAARKDLLRLENDAIDYLPDLSPEQKRVKLAKTSYIGFLLQSAKVHPDLTKLFQTAPHGLYGVGIDAVSADTCRGMGYHKR
jgi:hypothetical protein